MTRETAFNKVQDIFRDVFDEKDMIIEETTNSDDIEEWDSLNHINLVSAIEKDFGIKVELSELKGLKDVGAMVDLIMIKMG
jgi:acyl carrier protein